MTGMKITVDAAMRARDVSRPRSAGEDAEGPATRPGADARPATPADREPGPADGGGAATAQGSGGSSPDRS